MVSYASFVVRFYWLVLLVTFIVAVVCIAVGFTVKDLPDIDNPTRGFVARGTEIKGRYDAINNLRGSSAVTYRVSADDVENAEFNHQRDKRHAESHHQRDKRQTGSCSSTFGSGYRWYFKLAFASTTGANLWSLEAIQEMCDLDTRVVQTSQYVGNTPTHSIGRYIAELSNKSSCSEITAEDVLTTLETLKTCAPHYYEAWEKQSCEITVPGCDHSAIHIILNELTDSEFIGRKLREDPDSGKLRYNDFLTYALMWVDVNYYSSTEFYLDRIHNADLKETYVEVVAVDTTDRFDIFNEFLFRDMAFFIIGMSLIFIIMGLYIRSFLITLFTLFDVLFSFGIAYFLYMVVFNIPHMPFLGFMSILLLIAVAADDVFILYDAYDQAKEANPDKDMEHWMSVALGHAAISILVTSLTTGAALFANVVSDITDIKAFGIISGTAIVINYLLVVTWIPAAIVTIEKIDNCLFTNLKCCQCFERLLQFLRKVTVKVFHEFLPACISKLWFVWIILFLGLGIGGIVVTFVKPKLELPTAPDISLFKKDSVIGFWFQDLKFKFRYFERSQNTGLGMTMTAVWGVEGKDTGNHLDPKSKGDLKFDSSFDLSQPEAQTWMLSFCHELQNAPFCDKSQNLTCSLNIFKYWTNISCTDLRNILGSLSIPWDVKYEDCCDLTEFPVSSIVFKKCHYYVTALVSPDAQFIGTRSILGVPHYSTSSTDMKAYTMEFTSNQEWTSDFNVMDKFYTSAQDWMENQLKSAPKGVKTGWLVHEGDSLELYDLQLSLASGTYSAIGVSMAAAFVVMLITSLNVVITIYAIVTIFFTISVCAGVLVLLGWELNVVESVTLTMSVGLSIDFCIHYGMGYRLSNLGDRKLRVHESFKKVGAAIFMAASTTFLAGASVMPSIVLFYIQLGTFLMLVMACSWLFSTFFFQSLCYIIGPNGNFLQIPSPFKKCKHDTPAHQNPGTVSPKHNGALPENKHDLQSYENKAYDTGPGGDDVTGPGGDDFSRIPSASERF